MEHQINQPAEFIKVPVCQVPWMGTFRQSGNGQLMVKTALTKGKAIGSFAPDGGLVWMHKDTPVLIEKQNPVI